MVKGYMLSALYELANCLQKGLHCTLPRPLRRPVSMSLHNPDCYHVLMFDRLVVMIEILPCSFTFPCFCKRWIIFLYFLALCITPVPFSSCASSITEFLKINLKEYFILIC